MTPINSLQTQPLTLPKLSHFDEGGSRFELQERVLGVDRAGQQHAKVRGSSGKQFADRRRRQSRRSADGLAEGGSDFSNDDAGSQ